MLTLFQFSLPLLGIALLVGIVTGWWIRRAPVRNEKDRNTP